MGAASASLTVSFTGPARGDGEAPLPPEALWRLRPDDILLASYWEMVESLEERQRTLDDLIREYGVIFGASGRWDLLLETDLPGGGGTGRGCRPPCASLTVRFAGPDGYQDSCMDVVVKTQWQPMPPVYPGFWPDEAVVDSGGCDLSDPRRPLLTIYYDQFSQGADLEGAWIEAGWPLKNLRQWQDPLVYTPRIWHVPDLTGGEQPLQVLLAAPVPGADENITRAYAPSEPNVFDFTIPAEPLGKVIGARLPHQVTITRGGAYAALTKTDSSDTAPQPQVYQPPVDEDDADPRLADLAASDLYVDHRLRVDQDAVERYLAAFGTQALDWVDYDLEWSAGYGWGQWIFNLAHDCEEGENTHEVRMRRDQPSDPFSASRPRADVGTARVRPKRIWLLVELFAPGNGVVWVEDAGYLDVWSWEQCDLVHPVDRSLMGVYGAHSLDDTTPYVFIGDDFVLPEEDGDGNPRHYQVWVDLETVRQAGKDPETGAVDTRVELTFAAPKYDTFSAYYTGHQWTLAVSAYANGCPVGEREADCDPPTLFRRHGAPLACNGELLASSRISSGAMTGTWRIRYNWGDEFGLHNISISREVP